MNVKNNRLLRQLYYAIQNWYNNHSYSFGRANQTIIHGTRISSKVQFHGYNNTFIISKYSVIKNTLVHVEGNNNKIIISEGALVSGAELWIEDNQCVIEIGKNTFIGHHSHLACTEDGSRLIIGDDCLLSSYVQVRTGDSHSILDMDGKRINPAKSVQIGNHCWIGEGSKILKGVILSDGVIVSSGTIVTKSFGRNVMLGGIPAKIIKDKITWDSKRI